MPYRPIRLSHAPNAFVSRSILTQIRYNVDYVPVSPSDQSNEVFDVTNADHLEQFRQQLHMKIPTQTPNTKVIFICGSQSKLKEDLTKEISQYQPVRDLDSGATPSECQLIKEFKDRIIGKAFCQRGHLDEFEALNTWYGTSEGASLCIILLSQAMIENPFCEGQLTYGVWVEFCLMIQLTVVVFDSGRQGD